MTLNTDPSHFANPPTLLLDGLRSGKIFESKKLTKACLAHGFLYLDLCKDDVLCLQWERILASMNDYFGQTLEIKMQDAQQNDNYGYEHQGNEAGPWPGTVDGYETLKLFFDFSRNAHAVTTLLLERVSDELGLEGNARFEALPSNDLPTFTNMTLLQYSKDDECKSRSVGHNNHTEIGSFTFPLAAQWGLQILSLHHESWAIVKPRPKHAIINIGDSRHFLSDGRFLSAVHRVMKIVSRLDSNRATPVLEKKGSRGFRRCLC